MPDLLRYEVPAEHVERVAVGTIARLGLGVWRVHFVEPAPGGASVRLTLWPLSANTREYVEALSGGQLGGVVELPRGRVVV